MKYRISALITLLCLVSLVALPWFVLVLSPEARQSWGFMAGAAAWWGVGAAVSAAFNGRYQ